MRLAKIAKNSAISVMAQIIILLLGFITRKLFLVYLDIEMLGYETVFSNILTLLSATEMGFSGVIVFHLYKELADDNQPAICTLMQIYKLVYRGVAIVTVVLAIALFPFLHFIVSPQGNADWSYLRIVYILQVSAVVVSYFLTYRRSIFIADQKEYRCILADMWGKIFIQCMQIVVLILTRSFLLYLLIKGIGNALINVAIYIMTNRAYPYLKKRVKVTKQDVAYYTIFKDTKNILVHRIASAVYEGTDSIVISAFCGVRDVALYGNYYLLQQNVLNILLYRLLNPLQAALGNFVYSNKDPEKKIRVFDALDLFSFFFALQTAGGFLLMFQCAIEIWLGKEYLLPMAFVAVYCVKIYIVCAFEIMYKYRSAFGQFEKDRSAMLLSAVCNVALSILFVGKWGVVGAQAATAISILPIVYGRTKFVMETYLNGSTGRYMARQLRRMALGGIELLVVYTIAEQIGGSVWQSFAVRVGLWFVPLGVNVLLYRKSMEFALLWQQLTKFLQAATNKIFKGAKSQ